VQGFSGLLGLATVALEALLSVEATALSGFGLFSGVSFGLGHGFLSITITWILDRKETMSHRVSISTGRLKMATEPLGISIIPL
jgi:hypothetical protein